MNNQNGQAVMEYILVLIVLVFVFLILLQFNKQFRKWGEDYFIAYYRCLLETGEIPSLGGESNTGGICSSQYQPFTFTAGWQPYPGGGNGGDGSGGNGDGSGGGKNGGGNGGGTGDGNNSNRKADGEGSGSRGGEVSRVAGKSSGSGSNRFGRFKANNNAGDSDKDGSKKKKGMYTGSSEATSFSSNSNKNNVNQKRKGLNYNYGIQREDQERGGETMRLSSKKSEVGQKKEQRFKIIKRTISKESNLQEDEFTLGNFFRILIIAAIIIALGVLIGGQLLQISKGMDAEG